MAIGEKRALQQEMRVLQWETELRCIEDKRALQHELKHCNGRSEALKGGTIHCNTY